MEVKLHKPNLQKQTNLVLLEEDKPIEAIANHSLPWARQNKINSKKHKRKSPPPRSAKHQAQLDHAEKLSKERKALERALRLPEKKELLLKKKEREKSRNGLRKQVTKRTFEPHVNIVEFSLLNEQEAYTNMLSIISEYVEGKKLVVFERLFHMFVLLRASMKIEDRFIRAQAISSAVLTTLTTFTDKSTISIVANYLGELLNLPETQATNEDVSNFFSLVRNSWKGMLDSPLSGMLYKILTLSISAGMCKISDLPFNIGGFDIFRKEFCPKITNLTDLADAILGVVESFVKVGYKCFLARSVLPIFYNSSMTVLENDVADLKSMMSSFALGDLERDYNLTDQQFEEKIDVLQRKITSLLNDSKVPVERRMLAAELNTVNEIKISFRKFTRGTGRRERPFMVACVGPPGTGKTIHMQDMEYLLMKACGVEDYDSKKHCLHFNADDPYQSMAHNAIKIVVIDDLANNDANHDNGINPISPVIRLGNVAPFPIAQADLENKRGIFLKPEAVVLTSNHDNLGATWYSSDPGSVLRRPNLFYKLIPRPEFCVPGTTNLSGARVQQAFPENTPFRDLYTVEAWRYDIGPKKGSGPAAAVKVRLTEGPISYEHFLQMVVQMCKDHRKVEESIYEATKNAANCQLCSHCCMPPHYCHCPVEEQKEDMEPHASGSLPEPLIGAMMAMYSYDMTHFARITRNIPSVPLLNFCLIPRRCLQWCDHHITLSRASLSLLIFMMNNLYKFLVGSFLCVALALFFPIFGLFPLFLPLFLWGYACNVMRSARRQLDERPVRARDWRDLFCSDLVMTCLFVGVLARLLPIRALVSKLRFLRSAFEPHTALNPTSDDDIDERDAKPNVWERPASRPLPTNISGQIPHPTDLSVAVERNIHLMRVYTSPQSYNEVNLFYVNSNVGVLPYHFVETIKSDSLVLCARTAFGVNGSHYKVQITPDRYVRIPDTDLVLVWIPNMGNAKDLKPYLPDEPMTERFQTLFKVRNCANGEIESDRCLLKRERVSHTRMSFDGYRGVHSCQTRKGMCMGVHVRDHHPPCLASFHLGGNYKEGISGFLCKGTYEEAFQKLLQLPGVLPSGSEGEFRNARQGRVVVDTPTPHNKSAVLFQESCDRFQVFGSTPARAKASSGVCDTLISGTVARVMGVPNTWGPPKFRGKGKYPFQESLAKCEAGSLGFPPEALAYASKDLLSEIEMGLNLLPKLKKNTKPWSLNDALSGSPGVRYKDKMQLKTSAGFSLKGKKADYVKDVFSENGNYSHREPTDELKAEVDYIMNCWRNGQRSDSIYKASLKDEPTGITSEKVRVFQAGEMGNYAACKMLVGPIVRVLRLMNIVSGTAVGVDPTGPEWQELMEFASKFGEDRMIAGDYSGFDKRLPADVLSSAWWIIYQVAAACGYSEEDLCALRCASTDTIYSYQAYDGTLIMMLGSEPSGEPFTVDVDSLAGVLMMRAAFYEYCKSKKIPVVRFNDAVALIHNGDDHIGSVSSQYDGFDLLYISKTLTGWGMKYTSTDKSDEITERYQKLDETDFLKRVTTSVEGIPFLVGKLALESIHKCLHSRIASKEITDEVHACQVIGAALREFLFHGREIYEHKRLQLKQVAAEHGLDHLIPELGYNYDFFVRRHVAKFDSSDEPNSIAPSASGSGSTLNPGEFSLDDHVDSSMSLTRDDGGFETQANTVTMSPWPGYKRTARRVALSGALAFLVLSTLTERKEETTRVESSGINEKQAPVEQETANQIMPLGSSQQENVYYHEEGTSWISKRDDELSMAHTTGIMSEISLATFVQRPVRINTYSWAVGSGLEENFNPHTLYFDNPAVADKIKNFYRIQCGMRVKFEIVGNQFNFGRLLVAWQPFTTQGIGGQSLNQVYEWPGLAGTFTPSDADLCLLSQYPHLYLDPVSNMAGELEIPFVWYRNFFEVPTKDWVLAGNVVITTLSPLQAANGSLDPVTVQVIASPINLKMDLQTEFEPQMNTVVGAASQFDPRHPISSGLGIVSVGAGAIANAKGKKKNKKARKFAKAMTTAQLATKMAGNVASRFGFTRQPVGEGTRGFVPRYANTFSLTEGTSEAVPLTCYIDSQTTVSPDRFGAGNTDELTIASVACREAYFNKFTWSVSDTPGTNLFGCEVSPAIWNTNTITGMIGMTPMCFAVQPFEFWSGTIIFRFQIVSSSFHKGVVLIKYDPDAQATSLDLNLQTLASIDISKDRDITVEVGMSQIVPWLYHRSVIAPATVTTAGGGPPPYNPIQGPFLNNAGAVTIPQIVGDTTFNYRERLCLNGVISIQVFNSLVVPANSTTDTVEVLCHASAGSDFKVGSPVDYYIRDMTFWPPSTPPVAVAGTAETARTVDPPEEVSNTPRLSRRTTVFEPHMNAVNDPVSVEDGAPESLTIAHHFGAELGENGACCEQYMGESIESLRVLLHRKQYHQTLLCPDVGALSYWVQTVSDFPIHPGNAVPSGILSGLTSDNVVNMTYLNYITPAYALRAGSISNTYVNINVETNALNPGLLRITRAHKGSITGTATFAASTADPATFIYNGVDNQGRDAGNAGMFVTPREQNPTVDVNCPYYDSLNGYPAQLGALDESNVFTRHHLVEGQTRNVFTALKRFVSAGPDYSLGMFLSAPPVYARFTPTP